MLTVGLLFSAPARRPWSSSSPARMPRARSEISGKERFPPPPPPPDRRGKAEETLTPPSARADRTSEVEMEVEVLALPETRGPPMVLFTLRVFETFDE